MLESPRTGSKRLRGFAGCKKRSRGLRPYPRIACEALERTYVARVGGGGSDCALCVFFDEALHRFVSVCLCIVQADVQALRLKYGQIRWAASSLAGFLLKETNQTS